MKVFNDHAAKNKRKEKLVLTNGEISFIEDFCNEYKIRRGLGYRILFTRFLDEYKKKFRRDEELDLQIAKMIRKKIERAKREN